MILAKRKLDSLTRTIARVQGRLDELSAAQSTAVALLNRVEIFLENTSDLRAHTGTIAGPKKGEPLADCVARLRAERDALLAELEAVRRAPSPSAIVKAKALAAIDALAATGRPGLVRALHGDPITWPQQTVRSEVHGFVRVEDKSGDVHGFAAGQVVDALGLVAWLNRDALKSAIAAEIDALVDDAAALTEEQRAAREAELAAQLLSVERAECAAVDHAAAAGMAIAERSDVDARAWLGLA